MLYSFFITQWYSPSPGDWTEQVKLDLDDFNIPCDFDYIERKLKTVVRHIEENSKSIYRQWIYIDFESIPGLKDPFPPPPSSFNNWVQ